MTTDFKSALQAGLDALGLEVDAQQLEQLLAYLRLLDKSRHKINLVSVNDPMRLVSHHVLDSLSVVVHLKGKHILDFGTGAGLPGLPLACVEPARQFTLLDSRARRIEFLNYVCQQAKIGNVQTAISRVQDYFYVNSSDVAQTLPHAQTKFDTLVCRAVASLQDLLDMTTHLHAPGSRLIAMKGQLPEKEIVGVQRALAYSSLGYSIKVIEVYEPDLKAQRHLVMIDFK